MYNSLLISLSFLWLTAQASAQDLGAQQVLWCGDPIGFEVGNQLPAGLYALDYVHLRDAYDYQPVISIEDSLDRIEELLELLPSLQNSFAQFRRLIGNRRISGGARVWTYSRLEVAKIDGIKTSPSLPLNCQRHQQGDPFGVYDIVQRKVAGDVIFYESYEPLLRAIEQNPLQASFLYVHLWLTDYAVGDYQRQRANVILHQLHSDAEEVALSFVALQLVDPQAYTTPSRRRSPDLFEESTQASRGVIQKEADSAYQRSTPRKALRSSRLRLRRNWF